MAQAGSESGWLSDTHSDTVVSWQGSTMHRTTGGQALQAA